MPKRQTIRALRIARTTVVVALISASVAVLFLALRGRPEDLPWSRLDLAASVGGFTGRKLTALTHDAPLCRDLLGRAGVRYQAIAPVATSASCGYADGVRLSAGGARTIALAPVGVVTACPVAAALAVWEWQVVQPAAVLHFGRRVARIDHFGSYACRRIYGRTSGGWSEHAHANAIDVGGFQLEDGTRIGVAADWTGKGAKAAFLREVRDGACDLFATVLSPDYNAAHRDHLHLDQAPRGALGWRACR